MRETLTVITGPMFSGKSTRLIEMVRVAEIAGLRSVVFKPKIDTRYSPNNVCSHEGTQIGSVVVENARGILDYIDVESRGGSIKRVFVDEAQFFGFELVRIVEEIMERGMRVTVAGLNMDFRREPFGPMPGLLAIANEAMYLTAVCTHRDNEIICGQPAYFTQRLVNGVPANYYDPVVLVGASENYTARCGEHHQVPGRPRMTLQ